MKNKPFENKNVWVTGASSGIGEALSYALNAQGANLILSSRNHASLENVKSKCKKDHPIYLLPFDLSKIDSINEAVASAFSSLEKIDIMIHNAGVALRDLALNTQPKVDEQIMNTNYFGTIALTKALLPSMIRNGSGHFVVVSSLSGKYGVPRLSAYSASKHALHGFFDSLRSEVHPHNIKVSILIPGIVKTNITVNALSGDGSAHGKMLKTQAKGMSADECANKMLRAIAREKEEVLIGGPEIYTVLLKRFFPSFFSRFIRNHPIKKIDKIRRLFVFKKNSQNNTKGY